MTFLEIVGAIAILYLLIGAGIATFAIPNSIYEGAPAKVKVEGWFLVTLVWVLFIGELGD